MEESLLPVGKGCQASRQAPELGPRLHPSGPHSRHHSGVSLGPPCGYRATLPGRKHVSPRRGMAVAAKQPHVLWTASLLQTSHLRVRSPGNGDMHAYMLAAQTAHKMSEQIRVRSLGPSSALVTVSARWWWRVGGCVDRVERGDALDADLVVADWALYGGLGHSAVQHLPLNDLGHAVLNRALLRVVAGKNLVVELHGGQHGDHVGGPRKGPWWWRAYQS